MPLRECSGIQRFAPFGLKSPIGFWWRCDIDIASWDTATSRGSSLPGWEVALSAAIVSCVSSMGPPGSAREMAMPATSGERRSDAHSSSV